MPPAITLNFEKVFDASYERAISRDVGGKTFIQTFYDRFIGASPQVQEKFRNTDMTRQIAMLEKSLHYVAYLFNTPAFYSSVERIAALHSRAQKDIPPPMYDLWLESLIDTVREFDPKFDNEVELAWRLSLARGIAYMKFMHGR
ncbi:MAG: globin [Gammaproteobacteria bacterium]